MNSDSYYLLIFNLFNTTVPDTINNENVNLSNIDTDPCHYHKHDWLEEKLILISICGTIVALFGIFGNLTTALVLTRPGMRTPNNLYLTFLAIFDTLLLLAAISLYSIEYLIEYLDSLILYKAWIKYVRYGFALSHVAQTGSVYITVAVTFERYLAVLKPKRAKTLCTRDRTALAIAVVIAFSILFNSTKYFELEIVKNENCTGFAAERLTASAMLNNHIYQTVHSLWLTQMIMVFIPFIVLSFVNAAIVCKVRRSLKRLSWIQRGRKISKLKEKSRDATKISVVVVLVFLVCNSWGFVTTLMENMYTEAKLRAWWPVFYEFSREAINFLAIVNSSINFIIYIIFGQDFRRELITVWGCKGHVMLPMGDKFTADRLLGSHRRRPSALGRYINLIRVAQTMQKQVEEKMRLSERISEEGTSCILAHNLAPRSRSFSSHSLLDSYKSRETESLNRRRMLSRKPTISSGDYNVDFVSVGRDDGAFPQVAPKRRDLGNLFALSQFPRSSSWKTLLLAHGWTHGIVPTYLASSGNEKCENECNLMDSPENEQATVDTMENMKEKREVEQTIMEQEDDVWV